MTLLREVYNQLWPAEVIIHFVFLASLLVLFLRRKKSREGFLALGWISLFTLLVLFNPVIIKVALKTILPGIEEYSRIGWMLFQIPVIAYVFVELLVDTDRKIYKAGLCLVALLLLLLSNHRSLDWNFVEAGTKYKLNDYVVEMDDVLKKDAVEQGFIDVQKASAADNQTDVLYIVNETYYMADNMPPDGVMIAGIRQFDSYIHFNTFYIDYQTYDEEYNGVPGSATFRMGNYELPESDYVMSTGHPELEEGLEKLGYEKVADVNVYRLYRAPKEKRPESKWIVTEYPEVGGAQGMFYTIEDKEGHFAVVDGGFNADADQVMDVIRQHDNKVDVWILTHPHSDHIGAFETLIERGEQIDIGTIYTINMDAKKYAKVVNDYDGGYEYFERFEAIAAQRDDITYVSTGDRYDLFGMEMTVLNACDDDTYQYGDPANNGAMMFRLAGEEESFLFCSDVKDPMEDSIKARWGDQIKSTYIQMGHHGGVGSFSNEFYDSLEPEVVIFDMPFGQAVDQDKPAYHRIIHFMDEGKEYVTFKTAPNKFYLR